MKATKTKSLERLIKDKELDYVNPDITEDNFPRPEMEKVIFDLFHFDRHMSSEDAIRELGKDGWRPATLYDLLSWDGWNGKDWTVALGSVAEISGYRRVPFLYEDGSKRNLRLGWVGDDWFARFRFLRVRSLDSKSLGTPDALALGIPDSSAMEESAIGELQYANLQIEALWNALSEIESVPEGMEKRVARMAMERHDLDNAIHARILFDKKKSS